MKIAPSILAADFAHLARDIQAVERAGADLLHIDIMDGHFVPNLTVGPPVVAALRKNTSLPFDVHLMTEHPSKYFDDLIEAGANWISLHLEADRHLNQAIEYLKAKKIRAGVALNPATPLAALEEILPISDFILLMSVNPGFGGQKFIPSTLQKIRSLRTMIDSRGYSASIQVDGGIGKSNVAEVVASGADIIVAGSAVYGAKCGPVEAVNELRAVSGRKSEVPLGA